MNSKSFNKDNSSQILPLLLNLYLKANTFRIYLSFWSVLVIYWELTIKLLKRKLQRERKLKDKLVTIIKHLRNLSKLNFEKCLCLPFFIYLFSQISSDTLFWDLLRIYYFIVRYSEILPLKHMIMQIAKRLAINTYYFGIVFRLVSKWI